MTTQQRSALFDLAQCLSGGSCFDPGEWFVLSDSDLLARTLEQWGRVAPSVEYTTDSDNPALVLVAFDVDTDAPAPQPSV